MKLILIGAGGHAHDIVDIFNNTLNYQPIGSTHMDLLGCLDDKFIYNDKSVIKNPPAEVIGKVSDYTKFMSRYGSDLCYIMAINSSAVRSRLAEYLDSIHARPLPYLIHKHASIAMSATIGVGCVFGPMSVVTANAKLGKHVHLNTAASVNQGSYVGDFATLSPGARICGDVWVGKRVQFGANSTVINMKNIEDDAVIGAGAVVVNDIPKDVIAKGVPAKWIKDKADV